MFKCRQWKKATKNIHCRADRSVLDVQRLYPARFEYISVLVLLFLLLSGTGIYRNACDRIYNHKTNAETRECRKLFRSKKIAIADYIQRKEEINYKIELAR